ncbi:hypothetical protein GPJ56_004901 [Histomonas meleagridis]|uniref:uncharacterized protein n=1 Tax=Histomonas meleagridis TaxID=135588 RepID=UPI00355AAAA7|nr:hypothetical protein GPJ56_004901 [Histomonas meleagridis]KAH0806560.1 hypothetical protein GO595_000722 [Histomonas meleagridis]
MISKRTVKNTGIATFAAIASLAVSLIGLFQAYEDVSASKLGGINMKFDNFIRYSCLGFVIAFAGLVVCLCLSYKIAKFIALFLSLCFIGVYLYIIVSSNSQLENTVLEFKYIFEDEQNYEMKTMEIENQLECCGWESVYEPSHTCEYTITCHAAIQKLLKKTSVEIAIFFSISSIIMVISIALIVVLIKEFYAKKNEYIQIQQADGAELSYL